MSVKVNYYVLIQVCTCTKSKDIKVYMRDGSVIPYLDTCTHLGNVLCTCDKHVMIDSAVKDLNCRLNNLLPDFLNYNSKPFPLCLILIAINSYSVGMCGVEGKRRTL